MSDPEHKIPTVIRPKKEIKEKKKDPLVPIPKRLLTNASDDMVKKFFDYYLMNNELNVAKAAKKAGISYGIGYRLVKEHMNDPKRKIPKAKINCSHVRSTTFDQVKRLIEQISDGMSKLQEE